MSSAPARWRDGGAGALVVGEMDGSDSERVTSVVADLQSWGPAKATTKRPPASSGPSSASAGMLTATATADAPMADLIDRHRDLMHALVSEVFDVATGLGHHAGALRRLRPSSLRSCRSCPAATQATGQGFVAWLRTQAKDRSGIWRDLAVRRRPTEVPTHYEPVLEVAADAGVPVPLLTGLLSQIAELEHGGAMSEDRLHSLGSAR